MPELRIIISGKLEEMINKLIEARVFENKTEIVRVALLEYFHNHNWFRDLI
ncbi:MAG: hypothetical protein ACTSYB_01925 [Candidatus Helarchaeota archaeon]